MHPIRLGFLLAIVTIPLACQRATRSPEQEQLLALHPSLAAKATDWASLPFSHASGPLPGDPAKSVVVTWGAVPGLARGQIAQVAVLGKGDEGPTVLSRVAAAAADWPGDGELASVEISPAVYALNARASAFAVRIVRRVRELQPMLSIESIALYQYDGSALRRLLGCVTGFSEDQAGEAGAVRGEIEVASTESHTFADLTLSDDRGGKTVFQWNGLEYVPRASSAGQTQRVRFVSVQQVEGAVPFLGISGKGYARVDGGSAMYMWGSTTPPSIRVILSSSDAVVPALCGRLARTALPAGLTLELNGTGTFQNDGSGMDLSAHFDLESLSSCGWAGD